MKKLCISTLLLSLLFLTACEAPPAKDIDSKTERTAEEKLESLLSEDVEVLVIDDCEYIVYKHREGANLGFGFMAHKGNCKNPIHCRNSLRERVDTTASQVHPLDSGG